MKSGGFHVKSKDLLQGIVTLCLLTFLTQKIMLYVTSNRDYSSMINTKLIILLAWQRNIISFAQDAFFDAKHLAWRAAQEI